MTLDLYNFTSDKANIPVDVVFVHPITKAPTDIVFSVVGLDGSAAQACLDAQQAVRFNAMTKDGEAPSLEFKPGENRAHQTQLLVACTTGWKNLQWQGQELEFTPENAAMIYELVPSIREQVDKAVGDRKRFFSN